MKCPNCLTLMKCICAINPVPGQPGKERMDLHCVRPMKRPGSYYEGCGATSYMGVITEDPKEWQCHEYQFDLKHNDRWYMLRGYDFAVDPFHQSFNRELDMAATFLYLNQKMLIAFPYFIPISTGDDMHEQAWKLFHRLRNLIIYS